MFAAIRGFVAGLVVSWSLPAVAEAQGDVLLPGAPKGELHTELLQSRTYCRTLEKQLEQIKKTFPSLAVEVVGATSAWKSSPFAAGCDAIEADMLNQGGAEMTAILKDLDSRTWEAAKGYIQFKTEEAARDFLVLVSRRAKGEIEVEMVRGNLLWNHKPFQQSPEKEVSLGYSREIAHAADKTVPKVTFQVPMSWKMEESPNPAMVVFRNCYGHGNVWMTVLVSPLVDGNGRRVSAEDRFDSYSEDSLRAEYKTLGINLNSFTKTKVNQMPALMFTRDQLYEQLGDKATRAAEVIRVFDRGHSISFQINTLGPLGEPIAAERIEKNRKLFKLIGGSVRVVPQ